MRPLEKSILQNEINTIDTYINGAPMQLKNKAFVTGTKMYLPVRELLDLLGLSCDSQFESIFHINGKKIGIYPNSIVEINSDSSETSFDYVTKEIGNVVYVDALFFVECLDVTIAWEDDTWSIYICTVLHYDGFRALPDSAFDPQADNHYIHGLFMYLDGQVISREDNILTVRSEKGDIALSVRPGQMALEEDKLYRFCFSFSERRVNGIGTGRVMEIVQPNDAHKYGHMIYTEESYQSFKDFDAYKDTHKNHSQGIQGFNHDRLINMFMQYPDILEDKRKLLAILGDLFQGNKRNINLFMLTYDMGIVDDIKENELDDIFVYKWINLLTEEHGIQLEYATDTICLWCRAYGNGVLNKTFIAKKKYSPDIQLELQKREVLWRNSRMTHPRTIGDLVYFEPIEWYKKEAKDPYEGTYYYPYSEMHGMIWVTKLANISYSGGNMFSYNGLIKGCAKGDFNNILSSVDSEVAGLPGKKINFKTIQGSIEWEYDTYIMPTEDYVYMIWFGEKLGISPAMIRYEKEFISQIRNTKKLHKNQTLVFENAEDFEIRLNQGENLDGAIVTFEIKKVCPEINLVFGGYNLWGGEHLNFVSKSPMDVNQGDLFTVRVLYTTKTIGDSWVVHYVPLGDSNDEIEWAACDVEDIAEIVRKCRE